MSYKNFDAFNKALGDLAPTARSNLIFRLINIASQLSGVVEELPSNWARAYASLQQLQYDANGKLEDVTSIEAITSVDNLIYAARSKFLSLKNDLDSLSRQIEAMTVDAQIQHIDSRFNVTNPVVPGQYTFVWSEFIFDTIYMSFTVDSNGHFSGFTNKRVSGATLIDPETANNYGLILKVMLRQTGPGVAMLAALTSNGVLNVCNMKSDLTYIQSDGTSDSGGSELTSIKGSDLNVTNQSRDMQIPVTLQANQILSYNDGSNMLAELNKLVRLE